MGANEVVSDVFDELSSTKWMNWILYAIVGRDMLTIFDATIDSFINICENCWSIYEIEQVWVMFYPGSSTRIATLRGGFDTVWNDLFFQSLSVCIWMYEWYKEFRLTCYFYFGTAINFEEDFDLPSNFGLDLDSIHVNAIRRWCCF